MGVGILTTGGRGMLNRTLGQITGIFAASKATGENRTRAICASIRARFASNLANCASSRADIASNRAIPPSVLAILVWKRATAVAKRHDAVSSRVATMFAFAINQSARPDANASTASDRSPIRATT